MLLSYSALFWMLWVNDLMSKTVKNSYIWKNDSSETLHPYLTYTWSHFATCHTLSIPLIFLLFEHHFFFTIHCFKVYLWICVFYFPINPITLCFLVYISTLFEHKQKDQDVFLVQLTLKAHDVFKASLILPMKRLTMWKVSIVLMIQQRISSLIYSFPYHL